MLDRLRSLLPFNRSDLDRVRARVPVNRADLDRARNRLPANRSEFDRARAGAVRVAKDRFSTLSGAAPSPSPYPQWLESTSGDCLATLADRVGSRATSGVPASADKAALYVKLQHEFASSIADFYDEDAEVVGQAVAGSIKLFDALSLAAAIEIVKPRRILEVGSFLGFSTRWLAECSRQYDTQITSVDPGLRHRVFDDLPGHLRSFNAEFVDDERLTVTNAFFGLKKPGGFFHDYENFEPRKTRPEVHRMLKDIPLLDEPFGEFDLVFIDGDHSLDATLNNVALAAEMVPGPGCIIVHDAITWHAVQPALHQIATKGDLGVEYLGVTGSHAHDFLGSWWGNVDPALGDNPTLRSSLCDGLGYFYCPRTP